MIGTSPRRRAWTFALALLVFSTRAQAFQEKKPAAPAANSAEEPMAERMSLRATARIMDDVSLAWTRQHKCGTCHTNYAYMIARPALPNADSDAAKEIRAFFEDRVAHWDDADKKAKPRWDAEVVATAVTLALNDEAAKAPLSPSSRKALDRIWTLQKPDGSWNWLKCGWPPYEHDDYFGAVFAAVGVGQAPGDYAKSESAGKGLAKLRDYLAKTPAPDLHHRTFLLWANVGLKGLMTPEAREATINELLALQRPDGGWSLPSLGTWKRRDDTPNDAKDAPSDGYATGLVMYVLRKSGIPAESTAIQKGLAWLSKNQRASGRWFTRSLNNDKAHYIANAGTGFAALAVMSCRPANAIQGGKNEQAKDISQSAP